MKLAGGLLMIIGGGLAALTFMYQNDTGRSSPLELLLGIVLLVVGIILFNTHPKKKDSENKK